MATIEKSIEVNAPLSATYNQWTQFEEFPQFMQNVEQVQQLDDKRLHWKAKIGGKTKEWDAEIIEQIPDQRIAWRSIGGAPNAGALNFTAIEPNSTRVTLRLDYEPEGAMEKAGDALGILSQHVEGDLKRFKEFIESRQAETGAWRGEIRGREAKEGTFTEPRSKRIRES